MARYHVKGYVYVEVTRTESERESIDGVYEADSIEAAERQAEKDAEDEYAHALRSEVKYSRLTTTIMEETEAERDERDRRETYRAMVALKAPRLPGMEGVA